MTKTELLQKVQDSIDFQERAQNADPKNPVWSQRMQVLWWVYTQIQQLNSLD